MNTTTTTTATAVDLRRPRFKTVIFDVDSTVCALEGIDWLAARRDPEIARESEALTTQAMAGEIPIEAVYTRRLERIRPTAGELIALAEAYRESLQPGAQELITRLHRAGSQVHLLSGGLRIAIVPMALQLGVPTDRVHAVSLVRDTDGTMSLLDGDQPLSTQRGKPLTVHRLALAKPIVMIGDGSTDAAVRGVVTEFIAYTGVARRENVVAVADAEADSFAALYPLLFYAASSR